MIRIDGRKIKNIVYILFILIAGLFVKENLNPAFACRDGCYYHATLGCTGFDGCESIREHPICTSCPDSCFDGYCCDRGSCECDDPIPSCDAGYTTTYTVCATQQKCCDKTYCTGGGCGQSCRTCYKVQYTLTYLAGAGGSLSGTTPQTVCRDTNGTAVTANPNGGYAFVNWSDGSTSNPRTDTSVTIDKTVTANFVLTNQAPTAPSDLQTELATNPAGVTDTTPEFRARFQDPDSGNTGVHYQIQVNTNSSFTGTTMWDSGKISMTATGINSFSPEISYAGTALTLNSTTYYWRIKFWDNSGAESPWSSTSNYTMNGAPSAPTTLLTEGAANPTGVTDTTPEFSAIFNDPNTGNTGAYYEVNVNTNSSFTGTVMWSSGQVAMSSTAIGARSPDISYAGTALTLNGATYYWRVRFTDNYGTVGAWSTGTNSFTMNSAPTAPTSLQAEGATNPVIYADLTPEFSAIFNDPNTGDSANYYEIHVNTDSSFSGIAMWHSGQVAVSPVAIGARSPEISYAGTALTAGTYYWRIRFTDNHGTVGAWSATANFTINTLPTQPTQLQTEGATNTTGVTDTTPEFSAIFNDPDSDSAIHYEIEVNTNTSFTGTVMWDSTQTAVSAISNGTRSPQISYSGTALALDGTTYYWRIRFWDSYGLVSPWSDVANFKMNTPPALPSALQTEGLANPTGVSDISPELTALFSDPDGDSSTHYEVEVNTNSSFTGTVMWDSGQVSFTSSIGSGLRTSDITYEGLALTNSGDTYYWRIRLWDSNGTPSSWSLVNSFQMNTLPNTPSVLQTNGQTNPEQVTTLNPLFTALFNDPDGNTSTHYEVEVNSNSSFTGSVMWDSGQVLFASPIGSGLRTSDITYSGSSLVTNGETYYWRIRLWDSNGAVSQWSGTNSFKMLDVPNFVTSLAGVALSTTSIRWSFVDNADGESGILLYDQGDTLVKTCVGENLTYCDEDGLDENTQYTRYAVVYNSEAQSLPSNNAQRYTLLSVPTVSYLNKSDSTVTISSTIPINGGELYFDCEGDCDSNINQWTVQNTATVSNLQNNTSYTFKVKGRNGDNVESAYSSSLSVYTHSSVPTLSIGPLSTTSISLSASGINNLSSGDSGLFFECVDTNCDTGIRDWLKITTDVAIDLQPNTQYSFRAKSRNFEGEESSYSSNISTFTLATIPTLTDVHALNSSEISLRVLNGSNPSNTNISIQEIVTGKYVNISTGQLEVNPYWGENTGDSSPIIVSGLNPSTTYTFKVKARNGNNIETEYSGTSSATTLLATVSAISPTVDSTEQITWRISGDTSNILGIKLYTENGQLIKTCLGTDIYSCSESSLLPNITYARKMKIYNNLTESEFTNVISATTYANIPSLESITVGQYSNESVNIKVETNNNSVNTRYAIEEVTTGKYFNPNTQLLQNEISLSTYVQFGSTQGSTIYGLLPNTEYNFRVKAFNDDSVETQYSEQRTLITLASSPSIVSVNAVSNSSLKVLLSNGNNNTSTLFRILETKSNTSINTSSKILDNQTVWNTYSDFGSQNGITVTNLQPNTQYSFCAVAKNIQNFETECSQNVSAYTYANSASLNLKTLSSSSIEIVVNKNLNPSNTRYQILESGTNGSIDNENRLSSGTVLHDNSRVSSNFLLQNLPPDTTYSFKVRTVNSDEIFSTWSETSSVTTWANLPKDLVLETFGGNSGRVKFDRNGNPNSTRYAIQEKNTGKYLDYSTLQLVDGVAWGTYNSWGGTIGLLIQSLDPGFTYSFRVKAINSANVETSFVESNTGKTYSVIMNTPENITTVLVDDQSIDVSNVDGAQTGTQAVRILDNNYIVADLPISFDENRDWSNAIVQSSPENSKTVIKLDYTHGLTSKFTMYIVKRENDNALRVCPEARSLEEVNENCSKGVIFTGTFPKKLKVKTADITVSQAAISGVTYWIADGLTGTGAQGEYVEKALSPSVGNVRVSFFKTVEDIITNTVESLDSTALGEIEKERLTTVSATATAVTVSVGLTSIIGGLSQLGYSISQIFVNLFSLIGLRRKRYPLGFVYDSISKRPIQQAIVRIFDLSGKLADTAVTDSYGLFRTNIKPGEYTLEVKKREYSFPSELILGKEDYPMSDVYHGEKIVLKENEINIVIPIDPLEELTQRRAITLFKSLLSSLLPLLNVAFFVVGVTLSSYVYIKNQNIVNLLILLLYIPTTYILVKNLTRRSNKTGKVVFTDGTPASNITLILKDKDFDKVISKRVTDSKGRYSFNISEKGEYLIEATDSGIAIVHGNRNISSKGRMIVKTNLKIERI